MFARLTLDKYFSMILQSLESRKPAARKSRRAARAAFWRLSATCSQRPRLGTFSDNSMLSCPTRYKYGSPQQMLHGRPGQPIGDLKARVGFVSRFRNRFKLVLRGVVPNLETCSRWWSSFLRMRTRYHRVSSADQPQLQGRIQKVQCLAQEAPPPHSGRSGTCRPGAARSRGTSPQTPGLEANQILESSAGMCHSPS